jgi:hypothetical protein
MIPPATSMAFFAFVLLPSYGAYYASAEVVKFGACMNEPTGQYRCARNSTYCDDAELWQAPWQLDDVQGRIVCGCQDAHVGACFPSHGHLSVCRAEAAACPSGEGFSDLARFYNDGKTCMCHGLGEHPYSDIVLEFEETKYGACVIDASTTRCVMHSYMCEAGQSWLPPDILSTRRSEECFCHEVRTGACSHPLGSICAVDADSCQEDSTFLSPAETVAQGLDCRLCAPADVQLTQAGGVDQDAPAPTPTLGNPPTPPSNPYEDFSPHSAPQDTITGSTNENLSSSSSSGMGIRKPAFVALTVLAVLSVLANVVLFRKLRRRNQDKREATGPVTKEEVEKDSAASNIPMV